MASRSLRLRLAAARSSSISLLRSFFSRRASTFLTREFCCCTIVLSCPLPPSRSSMSARFTLSDTSSNASSITVVVPKSARPAASAVEKVSSAQDLQSNSPPLERSETEITSPYSLKAATSSFSVNGRTTAKPSELM